MHSLDSSFGPFTFPDPRTWPSDEVRRFHQVTEPRSLRDIFLFDTGEEASVYMEDAIAALAILPVRSEEWFTSAGYPSLVFPSWKIRDYTERLQMAGYKVWIMDQAARKDQTPAQGKVVSIASAREHAARRRRKWA